MARRIPASLTRVYNRAVKLQGGAAERTVRAALNEFIAENPDASVEEIREFAIELLQSAGELYGNACSQAALELQDEIAREFGAKPPDVGGWYYEPDAESIEKTAHYHAQKLVDGDVDGFVKEMADAARFYAERGANATMVETAKVQDRGNRRSRRSGSRTHGVTFARVPQGATTCSFCMMLASRGFVYLTEESAGEFDKFHRHCDCRIVPGYPGMELDGYDPDLYYDMWKHSEKYESQTEEASLNHGRWKSEERQQRTRDVNMAINCVNPVFISPRGNETLIANIRQIKHEENYYDIHAHGSVYAISCFGSEIDAKELAYILSQRNDYHGEAIRLFACHTGEADENGDCFAAQLAAIMHVKVKAAPDVTVIKPNGEFYFGTPEDKDFEVF